MDNKVNNKVRTMILSLYDVRRQKADMDKLEKAILADLKPLVDPKFDELPDEPIVADDVKLSRLQGVSRTISADLLLERGVAADVIAYSTKTTTYFQYRTTGAGKAGKA